MTQTTNSGIAPKAGPGSPRIVALYAIILLASLNIATYASLLPELSKLWTLTNTQAGTIGSAYFAAYTLAVPILTTLTDRVPAKLILMLGLAILAAGAALFATYVNNFQMACIAHAMMGFGFAGTYMPGLKALSDHVRPEKLSRSTAFYTSSFTIATGLSYILVTTIAKAFGWQTAFVMISVAAVTAFLIALIALPMRAESEPERSTGSATRYLLSNMRGALTNRTAVGYSIGYFLHCWELFAMRTWVVAFLAFAGGAALHVDGGGIHWLLAPAAIAAIMTALGFFASLIGNELSMKIGRVRAVTLVTLTSSAVCVTIALSVSGPYALLAALCLIHGMTSLGESASVTAGALGSARPGQRGATMALHATVGFSGAFCGPLAFGYLLDLAGPDRATGWMWAFLHMAAIIALTSVVLRIARPVALAGDKPSTDFGG